MDWDDIRIRQLEQSLVEHDKVRHRQRHMIDLAQLIEAAVGPPEGDADDPGRLPPPPSG